MALQVLSEFGGNYKTMYSSFLLYKSWNFLHNPRLHKNVQLFSAFSCPLSQSGWCLVGCVGHGHFYYNVRQKVTKYSGNLCQSILAAFYSWCMDSQRCNRFLGMRLILFQWTSKWWSKFPLSLDQKESLPEAGQYCWASPSPYRLCQDVFFV